jgi:hypothetical protein
MIDKKELNSPGYYQTHLGSLTLTTVLSFFLTILFFVKWRISDSPWYLWFCLVSVFIFIAFLRPVISKRRVRIENGNITFISRIGPPLTLRIAESLYEIVTKDDEIRSFRFETKKRNIQVSPEGYKDGGRLLKQIKDVIKREEIIVQISEK